MEDVRLQNIISKPGIFNDKACGQFANAIINFFQVPANMAEFKIWQAKRREAQAAK